jgi:guanine deaminase
MGEVSDVGWLERAIALAVRNVADEGGPFGAVVVRDGVLLAEGVNRVTATLDPTAHAEVVAIRAACVATGDFSLTGATLYASCEPCPLCLSAALWGHVGRVVYAGTRHDAAAAGFDDARWHRLLAASTDGWPFPVDHVDVPGANDPFLAWLEHTDRTPY